ncbi:hypothetical protein WJX84_002388 [Apatococcus fuscideae]|uniref:EF-hand domain-containing protein n=1 Tax=Apatococcus fuscideae TaxID=2026836 RepID=A0AAW1SZW3_9CHLO
MFGGVTVSKGTLALHQRPPLPAGLYLAQRKCCRQQRTVSTCGLFGTKAKEEEKAETAQASAPIPQSSPGSFLNKLGPLPLIVVGGVVVWGLIRSGFIWKNVTATKIPQETIKAVDLADSVAGSPKLDELFSKMDLNKDGRIDLKEVAFALKSVNPRASLSAARQSALDVFLLFDKDKNRYLDKEEFSMFMQRFCLLSDATFDVFVEELSTKLSEPAFLDVADKQVAKELEEIMGNNQVAEAIADRKLDGIFTVWDEDRDGSIKFKQLQMRLAKFSVPAASEQRTKSMMYSIPGNDDMDRATFGRFVEDFAKASGVSFADLADYLLVVPLHEFDPAQRS